MAPPKRIRLPEAAYEQGHAFYVTACTHKRIPWFARHRQLADDFAGCLLTTAGERGSELYAWCVMPDHVHLLLRDQDLIAFMRSLKGRTASAARATIGSSRLWQRSFFDRALRNQQSLLDASRYVWGNPVRVGLVDRAGSYAWSGSQTWPEWREDFGRG